ncbi:MAG: hypothetical protein ACTSR3_12270 [Candidatus Helarchaeota archaeon]
MSFEQKIKDLIKNLDDNPDRLHLDITPAVLELANFGLEVIPYLKESLSSTNEISRLHAQRVLEYIINRHLGFVPGQGWTRSNGEESFREIWKKNGSYDFEAPEQERMKSIRLWMSWYKNEGKNL